jgi:hypothetical protein
MNEGGFLMRNKIFFMTLLVILAFVFSPAMISEQAAGSGKAHAQGKIKLAVLDKMAKAQSARRFNYLYPKLTRYLRECFSKDGRFDLISPEEVGQALRAAGVEKETIDPDNADQLREIGRRTGADVVFISYYYEMGGHGMPMHSNNVLTLVWVEGDDLVKLDKPYTGVLSEPDLVSSDIEAFKELLSKASALFPAR